MFTPACVFERVVLRTVGLDMPVVALSKNAASFIVTAVSDIRRSRKSRAYFFQKAAADSVTVLA